MRARPVYEVGVGGKGGGEQADIRQERGRGAAGHQRPVSESHLENDRE